MERIVEENGEIKMPVMKDKFAFSKSRRFDHLKIDNHQIAYTPKLSDFDKAATAPQQRKPGMGGSSPRFDYYSNRRKQGALPSSFTYNSNSIATNRGGKSFLHQPYKAYSFGVSRHHM